MSIFDFPRVNFQGKLQLKPGTANNADYAQPGGQVYFPADWGPPYAGQPLSLVDSQKVEAKTWGMSDDEFIAWVKKAQPFDVEGGGTTKIVPAEWNYYGGMDSTLLEASVIGVQTGPGGGESYDKRDASVALTSVLGAELAFSGSITDVNSEGSPPATQFFIDSIQLSGGGASTDWLSVDPTPENGQRINKGVGLWINFFRNVSQVADAGSGTYVYHAIDGAEVNLPGWPEGAGVILRYYLALPLLENAAGATNAGLEAIYRAGGQNPKSLEIVGSFTPLLGGETLVSAPAGRLMISMTQDVPTGDLQNNGLGKGVALAPAVLQHDGDRVSLDCIGTFPDHYQQDPNDPTKSINPKFDFGPVDLAVTNGSASAKIATVPYTETVAGNRRGWVFDFDLSANSAAREILATPEKAVFQLESADHGKVLAETPYYFISNQLAIYGEQQGPGDRFWNQDGVEPATISVYHRGEALDAYSCPAIKLWAYRTVPIQEPGDVRVLDAHFAPDRPIELDTEHPGNYLLTFTIDTPDSPAPADYPPKNYGDFAYPPGAWTVTWAPSVSVRLLPNDKDFSRFYVDPTAPEPVANDKLTFEYLYENVLRVYYLLYRAMDTFLPLNSKEKLTDPTVAAHILERTEPALWLSSGYMPRTHDLSSSRRTLLRAWCHRVIQNRAEPSPSS